VRNETVARNYAETLLELARRHEGIEAYGEGIETVARMLEEDPRFRLFVETPRIPDVDKKDVVRKAFSGKLPENLVNFLLITIDKRRQALLRDVAREYHALVDDEMGREHVDVTLARAVDDDTEAMIAERLTALLGKQAIPHIRVKPEILGGIVVRTGDTIYDGSVRRRLEGMRRKLLQAPLPHGAKA
jgi:F-type H+-transporting ATPase subunit delta